MLREVLTQMELVNSMKLFSWFFSTANNPGAASTCSMGGALAVAMQPRTEAFTDITAELKSSHAPQSAASPVPTSSPAPQACTLPPLALPMSDIEASALQLGFHPSSSLLVPNAGSTIIPLTVYLMTNMTRGLASESRKSPSMMAATDLMLMPDQLPSKVAESESLSSISGMPRVTVGTVFHRSSLILATEPRPEPGSVRELQQLVTALTSLNSSSSVLPLIQPRVMPTLMMSWSWGTLEAQETGTPSGGR